VRLAMHVHGSWWEGHGSWEAQFAEAASSGVDVLFMTDHDSRAVAHKYLTSLDGAAWTRSSSGSLTRQVSTVSGGSLRLLAESASASAPASVTLAIADTPTASNKLRTSVAGHSLQHTFGTCSLTSGSWYEIRVRLSYHPSFSGRPAGEFEVRYRFGALPRTRFTEGGGLVGVVTAPTPAKGSTVTLTPETDIASLWPNMLAIDNTLYGLSFTVRSPLKGAIADVEVQRLQVLRSRSDPGHVKTDHARVVSSYATRFPGLTVRPAIEVSLYQPHMIPFGVAQSFPDYTSVTSSNRDPFYRQVVADAHAVGGVVSWNHPFGLSASEPLLSPAERTRRRREVFQSLRNVGLYGATILEVGYTISGNVDTATHLALWDTFSRSGTWLTGNGTSDDHHGKAWRNLPNGFITGVWSASKGNTDVVAALAAGRAYFAHLGRWPGGELDLLVDDRVPMGSVSVATPTSRKLAIWARSLPSGSQVQIVEGPVDYAGSQDPGTTVVRTLSPTAFSGGVHPTSVDTAGPKFVRVQVLDSQGQIVGSSNPIWLLRQQPPTGVPTPRRA
jgi:hypothetical protein